MEWFNKNLDTIKEFFFALIGTLMLGIFLTTATPSPIHTGICAVIPGVVYSIYNWSFNELPKSSQNALGVFLGSIISAIAVFCFQYFE